MFKSSLNIQRSYKVLQKLVSVKTACGRCQNEYSTGVRNLRQKTSIEPRGWVLLLVPVATFGLGTWQIQRRTWKLNLIKDLQRRTSSKPRELPEDISELEDMEYYPVVVRGEFDHSKEMFLGPRSLIKDGDAASDGSLLSKSSHSTSGFCVITPFHLADKNMTILINRGWVPHDMRNPAFRRAGQIEGEVELVGIVRLNEERAPFTPRNQGTSWFHRDLPKMAELADASPVFLDATYASTVHGGPIGGQTRISLRNEHLSYIFTWYTLSASTAVMWLKIFVFR